MEQERIPAEVRLNDDATEGMTVTFTVKLDSKHDIRNVRRLLKALLRRYCLRCVRIDAEDCDA